MNIQNPLNQTFTKLSLLSLYHHLFHVNTTFARWIYSIGSVQVAWGIALVCVRLFQCDPIDATYDPLIPGHCMSSKIILAVGDSINSLVDFIVIAMAVWIVSQLQMSRSTKVKLSILFALGGL